MTEGVGVHLSQVPGVHDEPALLRIEAACRYLSVCRWKLYELIRDGDIEAVKVGKSARVKVESLKRFIAGLPSTSRGSPIKRGGLNKVHLTLEDLGL